MEKTTVRLSRSIADDKLEAAQHELLEKGFYVVESYVSEDLCKALVDELEVLHASRSAIGQSCAPPVGLQKSIERDRLINNVVCYSPMFLNLATSGDHLKILMPMLNDPYYGLLPSDETNFILAQANAREGRSAIPFHVDVRMLSLGGRTWSYQGQLALSARNSRTGGLKVRPKSHLEDCYPDPKDKFSDSVNVDLKPGDLILFSSQLHHATYDTADGEVAGWAFNLTYRCWWVKQQFDFWNMLAPETLGKLTSSQQVILGGASQVPRDPDASPSLRTGYLPKGYFD